MNEHLRPYSQVFHSPVDTGAKENLSQKEELYKEALDSLPFGVILLDETSRIERTNRTAQQMFVASIATRKTPDFSNERTTGFYFMASMVAAEPKKFKELMGENCDSYELLHVQRYAGAPRYTRFSLQALQNPSKRRQILVVAEDVTEKVKIFDYIQHDVKGKVTSPKGYIQLIKLRTKTDEPLKVVEKTSSVIDRIYRLTQSASYEELTYNSKTSTAEDKPPYPSLKPGLNEFIFNNLPFGVAVLDDLGHVRLSNRYFRNSSGLDPMRQSYARIPYMLSGTDTSWFEEVKTGERESYEHIHHASGKIISFEFLGVEDRPAKMIAIARDVTGEVEAIDQLRKDYLDQTTTAQELARQMNEVITNPALKPTLANFKQTLENLEHSVNINWRHPLNYEATQRESVGVDSLLAEVYSELEEQVIAQGITPIIELNETPKIVAYRRELKEAFANLLSNAIHAMMDPTRLIKKLRIYSGMHETKPDTIKIEISDTGIGIPKEDGDKIYQHGFTRKKDVKHLEEKGVEGTGFGLSQVRYALRHHDGIIYHVSLTEEEIRKDPVKYAGATSGTTFYIELHASPQE